MKIIITLFVFILHNLPSPLHALRTYFCEDERLAHQAPLQYERIVLNAKLAQIEAEFAAYMREFRANNHDKLVADLAVILNKVRPFLPPLHPHNKNEIELSRTYVGTAGELIANLEYLQTIIDPAFIYASVESLNSVIASVENCTPYECNTPFIDALKQKQRQRQAYDQTVDPHLIQLSDLIAWYDHEFTGACTTYLLSLEDNGPTMRRDIQRFIREMIHVLTAMNTHQNSNLAAIITELTDHLKLHVKQDQVRLVGLRYNLLKLNIKFNLSNLDEEPVSRYAAFTNAACVNLQAWQDMRDLFAELPEIDEKNMLCGLSELALRISTNIITSITPNPEHFNLLPTYNIVAIDLLEKLVEYRIGAGMGIN